MVRVQSKNVNNNHNTNSTNFGVVIQCGITVLHFKHRCCRPFFAFLRSEVWNRFRCVHVNYFQISCLKSAVFQAYESNVYGKWSFT